MTDQGPSAQGVATSGEPARFTDGTDPVVLRLFAGLLNGAPDVAPAFETAARVSGAVGSGFLAKLPEYFGHPTAGPSAMRSFFALAGEGRATWAGAFVPAAAVVRGATGDRRDLAARIVGECLSRGAPLDVDLTRTVLLAMGSPVAGVYPGERRTSPGVRSAFDAATRADPSLVLREIRKGLRAKDEYRITRCAAGAIRWLEVVERPGAGARGLARLILKRLAAVRPIETVSTRADHEAMVRVLSECIRRAPVVGREVLRTVRSWDPTVSELALRAFWADLPEGDVWLPDHLGIVQDPTLPCELRWHAADVLVGTARATDQLTIAPSVVLDAIERLTLELVAQGLAVSQPAGSQPLASLVAGVAGAANISMLGTILHRLREFAGLACAQAELTEGAVQRLVHGQPSPIFRVALLELLGAAGIDGEAQETIEDVVKPFLSGDAPASARAAALSACRYIAERDPEGLQIDTLRAIAAVLDEQDLPPAEFLYPALMVFSHARFSAPDLAVAVLGSAACLASVWASQAAPYGLVRALCHAARHLAQQHEASAIPAIEVFERASSSKDPVDGGEALYQFGLFARAQADAVQVRFIQALVDATLHHGLDVSDFASPTEIAHTWELLYDLSGKAVRSMEAELGTVGASGPLGGRHDVALLLLSFGMLSLAADLLEGDTADEVAEAATHGLPDLLRAEDGLLAGHPEQAVASLERAERDPQPQPWSDWAKFRCAWCRLGETRGASRQGLLESLRIDFNAMPEWGPDGSDRLAGQIPGLLLGAAEHVASWGQALRGADPQAERYRLAAEAALREAGELAEHLEEHRLPVGYGDAYEGIARTLGGLSPGRVAEALSALARLPMPVPRYGLAVRARYDPDGPRPSRTGTEVRAQRSAGPVAIRLSWTLDGQPWVPGTAIIAGRLYELGCQAELAGLDEGASLEVRFESPLDPDLLRLPVISGGVGPRAQTVIRRGPLLCDRALSDGASDIRVQVVAELTRGQSRAPSARSGSGLCRCGLSP